MRTVFPLISHPATFLLPPWLVLTTIYALLQGVNEDAHGYWVGTVSSATVFTMFACTYAALSAAVSGGRIRRAESVVRSAARGPLQIAAAALWPTVLGAIVIQIAGLLLVLGPTWAAPGRFPGEVLVSWAAMILLHTLVGYLLGRALPPMLSAPLALLLSYVWLGFTWSLPYIPLRYLSGLALSGCCAVYSSLPWQAPVATTLFSLGVALVLAWLAAAVRSRVPRLARIGISCAAIGALAATSLIIARDLGPYPSPPRSANDTVCEDSHGYSVCLFPEQRAQAVADATETVGAALHKLSQAGISTPTRVTGALLGDGDATTLVYRRSFPAHTIVESLASSFIPRPQDDSEVCERDMIDGAPAQAVGDVTTAVLVAIATGDQRATVPADEAASTIATAILHDDPAQRAAWIEEAIAALDDCDSSLPTLARVVN